MSFVTWLREKLLGPTSSGAERRRSERYPVTSGLEVIADGRTSACRVDNVSAGGVRVVPTVEVPVGTVVTVRDPATVMSLHGEVLGHEGGGSRVRFASEDAGIIVSTWMRMAGESESAARGDGT